MTRSFYAACFLVLLTIFFQSQHIEAKQSDQTHKFQMVVAQAEQPAAPSPGIGVKIASKAKWVAKRTNTVGWCFKAIKMALKPFGVSLEGGAAYLAKEQLQADRRFEQKKLEELQPGDILVHGKSDLHPYGHICIYLGNKEEASDHVQPLIIGGGYGDTVVFRIKPWNPVGEKLVGEKLVGPA